MSDVLPVHAAQRLVITLFPGVRKPQGARREVTWDELCALLSPSPPPPFAGEEEQEGWAPCEFTSDYRSKANVRTVHAIAVEHDGGIVTERDRGFPVEPALAMALLSARGIRCILITTKSHAPGSPRWRLVICLSRPITADERVMLLDLIDTWGLSLKRAESRNVACFWYLTCAGAHEESGRAYMVDGAPLDVDRLLSDIVIVPPALSSMAPVPSPASSSVAPYVRTALDKAHDAIAGAPSGSRHVVAAREAYAIGGLVGGGHVDESTAYRALASAIQRTWSAQTRKETERTIRGQIAEGAKRPRTVEPPRASTPQSYAWSAMTAPEVQPVSDTSPAPSPVRVVQPGETPDQRPAIFVRKGEIPRMVDASIAALAQAEGDLYTRDGELVHVANVPEHVEGAEGELGLPPGAPKLYTISPPGLTERLARAALWLNDKNTPADPPAPVVHGLLARRSWPSLRPIAGIITAPTMRPDGSLITRAGYDPMTRMLYVPSEEWPELHTHPTREDANKALHELFDVFADFPWEKEDGVYVALAATLTIIARPAVLGAVPVFIFDANTPGSGKTLVADTIATIATGREAGRHSYPSDPKGGNEEVAKVLAGYAIAGVQVLCWDNLCPDALFGGPALESVSTARDTASFRILGKSENVTIPWRTVMLATGNNVAITRDLERRSLVPRFVARWETADSRPLDTFRHPDRFGKLLTWVRAHRIRLVCAALTLLRAYHLAGRPPVGQRWASFEEWADLIPSALVWAGGVSPLACRPADTGRVSPEREALAVILRDWSKVDPHGEGASLRSVVALLYPDRRPGEPQAPDGLDELRDALEVLAPPRGGKVDTTRLSGAFRRLRQVSVGGRAIETVPGRAGSVRWVVR